ncbi:hypothetical protein KEM52_000326, partial [Ascosphaera acerosa]
AKFVKLLSAAPTMNAFNGYLTYHISTTVNLTSKPAQESTEQALEKQKLAFINKLAPMPVRFNDFDIGSGRGVNGYNAPGLQTLFDEHDLRASVPKIIQRRPPAPVIA